MPNKMVNNDMDRTIIDNPEKSLSLPLRRLMSQLSFRLRRDGITTSYAERLLVAILRDKSSAAHRILRSVVGDAGISSLIGEMEQYIAVNPHPEELMPDAYYLSLCKQITANNTVSDNLRHATHHTPCTIGTAELLRYLMSQQDSLLRKLLSIGDIEIEGTDSDHETMYLSSSDRYFC